MRADNKGEGGTLALMALAQAPLRRRACRSCDPLLGRDRAGALLRRRHHHAGDLGAEGRRGPARRARPARPYVLPIALLILIVALPGPVRAGRRGRPAVRPGHAAVVPRAGGAGLLQIAKDPAIFRPSTRSTASPSADQGLGFASWARLPGRHRRRGALRRHGPLRPARSASPGSARLPGLLLNYLGQGALVLTVPARRSRSTSWCRRGHHRAGALADAGRGHRLAGGDHRRLLDDPAGGPAGLPPRIEIKHTSETQIGQIYIPQVNCALMIGVVAARGGFGSSGALAGAYGIAVTGAMFVDAALAIVVAILVWRWGWPFAVLVFGLLACRRRLLHRQPLKIPDGGWLPLVVAALIYLTITTWGTAAPVAEELERRRTAAAPVPRAHGARAATASPAPPCS